MAENKKSFLLYCDLITTVKKLPMDKRGELLTVILEYVNDENPSIDDILVDVVFEPIKLQFKRDLRKYETVIERNKVNGAKGGRPKKEEPKKPSGLSGLKNKPKKPDNVTDNVTVNDNVNVTVNDINKKRVYAKGIHDCFKQILESFPKHLHPKKGKPTDNWLDTIEKLERIDNIPLKTIIEITKKTRADDFWSKNFMSITKLRKTNGDGIPYIVVFNEKFKSNGQNNQNGINGNRNNESISEKVHRIMGRE